MQIKPLWLFSYDVSDKKRIKKAHKLCSDEGWALQKSVFVLPLTAAEKKQFCRKISEILDKEEDRLLCLPFTTPNGSFHWGRQEQWQLFHTDERLNGFVN